MIGWLNTCITSWCTGLPNKVITECTFWTIWRGNDKPMLSSQHIIVLPTKQWYWMITEWLLITVHYFLPHFSDSRVRGWLLLDSYLPTLSFTLVYLLIIYLGPIYMKNRPAYSLKKVLLVYNFAVTMLSLYMLIEVRTKWGAPRGDQYQYLHCESHATLLLAVPGKPPANILDGVCRSACERVWLFCSSSWALLNQIKSASVGMPRILFPSAGRTAGRRIRHSERLIKLHGLSDGYRRPQSQVPFLDASRGLLFRPSCF